MNAALSQFLGLALPETIVGAGICVVLLAGLFAGKLSREVTYLLTMATLIGAAWAAWLTGGDATQVMEGGAFAVDAVARLLKFFAFAATAVVLVYARTYLRERQLDASEFHVLVLFALLGIMVMISAASFLMMYLGLETLALALYAMVAFERDAPLGAEAAIKYFVLGAIASGCLLYGISLVYGATGSVNFADVAQAIAESSGGRPLAVVAGMAFMVVGIAFKFGALPFHMWLPDVYQGAPASSTLFIATVPKIAAFALALRLLVDGLSAVRADWQTILAFIGILSVGAGNIIAIAQTSIRRMLAYSTVGHVGFIFLGFSVGVTGGINAAMFYTVVYVLMTTAAFGLVILLSPAGTEADALDDFRGLNQRSPWFAFLMLLVMVSMIGVPPLAGFYAKWWILSALLEGGHTALALAAVFFSVIGAFYYLRVIRLMYFEGVQRPEPVDAPGDFKLLLSLNAIAVLAAGLFPAALLELCGRALAAG